SKEIIHYERDTLYERLGYAPNDRRDYWFWGRAAAQNGQATSGFQDRFSGLENMAEDSNYIKLRIQMQGLTNSPWCNTDHKAYVDITDQPVGSIIWDGQNTATFEKDIYISEDSIRIFPSGNRLNVLVRGDVCDDIDFDEIRINWYEFEYWRLNRTNPNHYTFKNPVTGMNRYWVWEWQRNNMKIYIPGTSEVIADPQITDDQYNSVLFVHASDRELEYFCTADDYFLNPDSIIEDSPSGLRDLSNGADYIIITHPDFKNAAERLAAFRRSNFPDTTILNARVAVADIFQIYDEFSYGLVDPYALQEFAKYAFGNWQVPAPSYLVLLGDMSYDYRQILPSSRKNYIPSIPYRSFTYGQAASDNMIAAVSGGDIIPDLIIGRLSCESMEEADILVDKIINYPADNRKEWKQNVLLLSSGLDLQDELALGFNDANLELENLYLRPNGLAVTKVFRYPSKPLHEPFRGEGPQIREEINKGAALINYYGHGGGFQWDLVFTNDDILLLENQGLLPVVLSVTCYTAHFDNQEVFGEVFNSVPGKGSIGFFGSSGLTYWGVGKSMNKLFFNDVFNNNNYVIGKAMLNAKVGIGTEGLNESQVALLTYLGDPVLRLALPDKPDFKVTGSDILFTPENPLVKDTINIKVKFRNVGLYIPGDSVLVQLAASSPDTSFLLFNDKLPIAGEYDSLIIEWIPSQGGLYDLEVTINESGTVAEDDRSDNAASASILIFNIREPSIIKPYDGLTADSNKIEFIFADIGHYVNLNLLYHIEIDTSLDFNEPLIKSGPLTPASGILKWISPVLNPGTYLWRARVSEGSDSGAWSGVRGFTIMQEAKEGYYASGKILKTFDTYNINYLEPQGYLSLNTKLLSPKPSPATFIEDILFGDQVLDSVSLTTLTTDGTYLYFGNMWYFALRDNPEGKSKIYKVGTGNNGTVKGMYYGEVPQFYDRIQNSIFYHSDGFIYVASGS
ncbi:MAG: C25 family cysteine peptidase, partial [Ignavibacteria bacterium]